MATKTTTNLSTLKINYLTQSMYNTALNNNEINENELYFTPSIGEDTLYLFTGTASGSSVNWYYNITVTDSSAYLDTDLCKAKFMFGRANGQYCANHASYYVYRASSTVIRYVITFPTSVYPNSGDTLYAYIPLNIEGAWAISM